MFINFGEVLEYVNKVQKSRKSLKRVLNIQ